MVHITQLVASIVLFLFSAPSARAGTALEILGPPLNDRSITGVAVDAGGHIYVARPYSDDVLKITPEGQTTQIINASGGGAGPLEAPQGIAIDSADNVYVAGGFGDTVFKITPGGSITLVLDGTGDGTNDLRFPNGIAIDSADNLYVTGGTSDNVFKVTPAGVVTQIIDATGDGVNALDGPQYVVVDSLGNVYVSTVSSHNVFKITAGGTITELWSTPSFTNSHTLAVDGADNVYVTTATPQPGAPVLRDPLVLKITPGEVVTPIVDVTGDGANDIIDFLGIDTDPSGNVYVGVRYYTGGDRYNILRVTPAGSMSRVFEKRTEPENLRLQAIDGSGNLYFSMTTGQVFAITDRPVFGHRFSFTTYSGDPPVGRLYRLLMKFRENGNITPFPLPGDPVANGGSVTVTRDGGTLLDPLTAGTWTGLGSPPGTRGWKYRNPDAPVGGEVSVLVIKEKSINVLTMGTGTMPPPSGASCNITTLVEVDDQTYCAHAKLPHAKDLTDRVIKTKEQWANLACSPSSACSPSGAFLSLQPSLF
jgi:hypothetical protein